MDLHHLTALVIAVEHDSIAGAARELGITPRTLRRRLAALEEQLGARLRTATARPQWTPSALRIAREGRPLLADVAALVAEMRATDDTLAAEFRVAFPHGLHPNLLAFAVARVGAVFPRLTLRIITADDPLALLPDAADVAFIVGPRPTQGPWLTARLLTARERLLAHPDYLRRAGPLDRPEDLEHHRLLTWVPPGEDPTHWPLADGRLLPVRCAVISTEMAMLHRLADLGAGVVRVYDGELPGLRIEQRAPVCVLPDAFGRQIHSTVVMPDTARFHDPFRRLTRALSAAVEVF